MGTLAPKIFRSPPTGLTRRRILGKSALKRSANSGKVIEKLERVAASAQRLGEGPLGKNPVCGQGAA